MPASILDYDFNDLRDAAEGLLTAANGSVLPAILRRKTFPARLSIERGIRV